VRQSNGLWHRFAVAVDDPRLQVLKQKIANWERSDSSRELRVARWHREAAEYYLNRQLAQSPPASQVAQVAFVHHDRATGAVAESPWSRLKMLAETRIERETARLDAARASTKSPVELGPVIRDLRPLTAVPFAVSSGLAVVALAVWRQRRCPPRRLCSQQETANTPSQSQALAIQIPRNWIRLRQSWEVVGWRLGYHSTVATAALLSLWSLSQL
jgi:hypothetical protein